MNPQHLKVTFIRSGRGKAQCPSNPAYPEGIDVETGIRTPPGGSCRAELPYPAPECGVFKIECGLCRATVMVTAAGRRDDPKSATFPCQLGEVKACQA